MKNEAVAHPGLESVSLSVSLSEGVVEETDDQKKPPRKPGKPHLKVVK